MIPGTIYIYTLAEGHTRTYVAYKNGISVLPVVYDNDDIITNQIGQMLYKEDIDWCRRFKISHIKHLESRIPDRSAYQKLWHERCNRRYNLLTKTSYNERIQQQCLAQSCFYTKTIYSQGKKQKYAEYRQ